MLSALTGAKYLERVAVDTPQHVMAAKKAIKKAFENQVKGVGFSMVESAQPVPDQLGRGPAQIAESLCAPK